MVANSFLGTGTPVGFTPVPNHLIDDVMPTLTDTQWRVLCVVARQTLGWESISDDGDRKHSDWLTHRQLKYRTERGNSAVSQAVDVLVRRGLVLITDEKGQVLATPRQRQTCRTPLYYCLATSFPSTTPESGKPFQENDVKIPQSGFHKAETTKQTQHKTKEKEIYKEKEKPAVLAAWADPQVRRFLSAYFTLWKEKFGRRPLPINWKSDAGIVQDLLAQYSVEQLIACLEQFFTRRDIQSNGYSLQAFQLTLEDLARAAANEQSLPSLSSSS